MQNKRVTIHDVARHAGVSHTTVSWVIHDDKRISPGTKERVREAIRYLNYYPNQTARSLVRGTTNTIAVVSAYYSSAFEIEILKGMDHFLDTAPPEFSVTQFSTRCNPEIQKRILEDIVYGRKADGLICLNLTVEGGLLDAYLDHHIPVVLIEARDPRTHSIVGDSRGGAYAAVTHLLEQGKKRIAFVGGHRGADNDCWSAFERRGGYKDAHKAWGIEPDPAIVFPLVAFHFEEGLEVFDKLWELGCDGVFCAAGDVVAMGILARAKSRNIKIPRDLGVVGYDNLNTAGLIDPPLTSVSQDLSGMGEKALETCIQIIEGQDMEPLYIVYSNDLVIRGSSC